MHDQLGPCSNFASLDAEGEVVPQRMSISILTVLLAFITGDFILLRGV